MPGRQRPLSPLLSARPCSSFQHLPLPFSARPGPPPAPAAPDPPKRPPGAAQQRPGVRRSWGGAGRTPKSATSGCTTSLSCAPAGARRASALVRPPERGSPASAEPPAWRPATRAPGRATHPGPRKGRSQPDPPKPTLLGPRPALL